MSICLFSGIPASGKTTTARQIASSLTGISVTHLNYDDFIQSGTCYREFRKEMLNRIENFVEKWRMQKTVQLLIVDDNMILKSMRKEVHTVARKHRIGYFQVFFKTSLNKALERNRSREFPVPDETISKLFTTLEDPGRDGNVDTVTLDVDANQSLDLVEFRKKVIQHMKHPETPPEPPEEKEKVAQSDLHRVDLILRNEISRRIQEAPDRENMRRLSEILNTRRKDLMKMFRKSSLEIPESIDDVRSLLNECCTTISGE